MPITAAQIASSVVETSLMAHKTCFREFCCPFRVWLKFLLTISTIFRKKNEKIANTAMVKIRQTFIYSISVQDIDTNLACMYGFLGRRS